MQDTTAGYYSGMLEPTKDEIYSILTDHGLAEIHGRIGEDRGQIGDKLQALQQSPL